VWFYQNRITTCRRVQYPNFNREWKAAELNRRMSKLADLFMSEYRPEQLDIWKIICKCKSVERFEERCRTRTFFAEHATGVHWRIGVGKQLNFNRNVNFLVMPGHCTVAGELPRWFRRRWFRPGDSPGNFHPVISPGAFPQVISPGNLPPVHVTCREGLVGLVLGLCSH